VLGVGQKEDMKHSQRGNTTIIGGRYQHNTTLNSDEQKPIKMQEYGRGGTKPLSSGPAPTRQRTYLRPTRVSLLVVLMSRFGKYKVSLLDAMWGPP
jgi:hypothetical protein